MSDTKSDPVSPPPPQARDNLAAQIGKVLVFIAIAVIFIIVI